MNWNHFILLLTGIYLGYYAINILADLYLKGRSHSEEDDQDVLFFSEDAEPEIIIYDDTPDQPVSPDPASKSSLPAQEPQQVYPATKIESTGAVSLKELMRVAQQGVLQYTKAIPY